MEIDRFAENFREIPFRKKLTSYDVKNERKIENRKCSIISNAPDSSLARNAAEL